MEILADDIKWLEEKSDLVAKNKAKVYLRVTTPSGAPAKNIYISGATTESGGEVYTNEKGLGICYVTGGAVTLSVDRYADLNPATISLDTVSGNRYEKSITLSYREFVSYSASTSIYFSDLCTSVDYSICGGGGGGGGSRTVGNLYCGGGGGGGYGKTGTISPQSNRMYSISIGSGGAGGTSGTFGGKGGATTFGDFSAEGGNGGGVGDTSVGASFRYGGAGNGNGGNGSYWPAAPSGRLSGSNGGAGSGVFYTSLTAQVTCGGGGGGGNESQETNSEKTTRFYGSTNGGNGAYKSYASGSETYYVATAGSFPGGGGGGGARTDTWPVQKGMKGGSGGCAFRMHH